MVDIPEKSDVEKRIRTKRNTRVQEIIKNIAERMRGTEALSFTIPADPQDNVYAQDVLRAFKDKGWTVTFVDDQRDNETFWAIS